MLIDEIKKELFPVRRLFIEAISESQSSNDCSED